MRRVQEWVQPLMQAPSGRYWIIVCPPGISPLPAKPAIGRGRPPKLLRRAPRHEPASVKILAMALPAGAFQAVTWREGTNTALMWRFAAVSDAGCSTELRRRTYLYRYLPIRNCFSLRMEGGARWSELGKCPYHLRLEPSRIERGYPLSHRTAMSGTSQDPAKRTLESGSQFSNHHT